MRVKIDLVGPGLHPSEVVVGLETRNGREELVVDTGHIDDDALYVGWPVGRESGYLLIELPQETFRGHWRVWVEEKKVLPDPDVMRKRA